MSQREHFLWVEKYRPKTLDECILPSTVKATLDGIMKQEKIPNLLFSGRPGTGKTTVARALIRQLGSDALVINGSEEGRLIETLRMQIKDYASSLSLDGGRKYVVIDEADYLNPQTIQPALRAFVEEFSISTGFVLTANFPQKIISPLHSRFTQVDFKIPVKEKQAIAMGQAKRAFEILTAEGITFDKKIVLEVVTLNFPDFRKTLNQLQQYSGTGTLSEAVLSQMSDKDIEDLFTAVKSKDFTTVRKWVGLHDMDAAAFYRMLYDQLPKRVGEGLAEVIVQTADYSYRSAFAADQQLNATACLVEIMHSASFK